MDNNDSPKFIDRTLSNLRRAWTDFTGAARVKMTGAVRPDLPEDDRERLKRQIEDCLEGRGGEVSGRARAADLGRTYLGLNAEGREHFLQLLANSYGVDEAALAREVANWSKVYQGVEAGTTEADELREAETALREVLTPRRVRLLAQFNALPQGVKFLVDMRSELIPLARKQPSLRALDDDLKGLLASWFDVGFLDLRCITWDAPASLLEKLARYEAVHAVKSWSDIKNRLAADRRCYAFFHPQMPDEPLIYVWVALVKGMSFNVQTLLDVRRELDADPSEADTAIFYSISNAQTGLAGISFGNFLIKRVVGDLADDFKNLKTFATLSPIPGFRQWLDEQIAAGKDDLLLASEQQELSIHMPDAPGAQAVTRLCDQKGWYKRPEIETVLRTPLMRLCARYLTQAKRGKYALDRVAHFHLSNGARMQRINWLGDTSARGLRQSAGMMINYLYKFSDIEKNHEAYRGDGKIKISNSLKGLLKG